MDTPPVTNKKPLISSLTKTSLTPCRRVGLGRPSSGSAKKLVQVRTVTGNTPSHDTLEIENQRSSSEIRQNKTIETPTCGLSLKVPMNLSNIQNKETNRVRRCLTQDPQINRLHSVKRSYNEIKMENGIIPSNESRVNCSSFVEESNTRPNKDLKKLKAKVSVVNEDTTIGHENKNSFLSTNESEKILADMSKFEKNKGAREMDIDQLIQSLVEKKKKLDQLKVQETYAKKHNLEELRAQTAMWRTAGQEALRYCVKLTREAGQPVTIHQLMVQHGFPQHLMGYNLDDDEFE